MRVGVVGAGVSGLAAARELLKAGCEVTVFEAADHVGGRCRTVRLGDYVFDPGATSIVPRDRAVEHVVTKELDATGLVSIASPVFTHDGRRIFHGDGMTATARYCYVQGIQRFPEMLAEGLDVQLGRRVEDIEVPKDGGFSIFDQAFEALVLATTATEAERLSSMVGDPRKAYNTRYRSCISAMFGFKTEFHAPYHAIVAEESVHPLHWLSVENIKVPEGRAPQACTALVVQMGPKYSKWNFEAPDAEVVEDALVDVERVLGKGFESPEVHAIVRWSQSQPDSVSGFDSVNPAGSRLVVVGDGLEGGRIELAYDSGVKGAKLLLDLP